MCDATSALLTVCLECSQCWHCALTLRSLCSRSTRGRHHSGLVLGAQSAPGAAALAEAPGDLQRQLKGPGRQR